MPCPAAAQAPEARPPLTLAAALEIAEARSESVALAQTALVRNEGDYVRAKSGRRPQLSGSATYERSLANEFQGVFDDIDFGGGDDGSGNVRESSVGPGEHLARDVGVLAEPLFRRPPGRSGQIGGGRTPRR